MRDLSSAPVAAHIHLAPRHVPGPVVVPLTTPPAAISTDPKAYYVNVHTPTWPAGEIRGHLKK